MIENKNTEYKSLKKVFGKSADIRSLAELCVCFANAQGGRIIVGIEDGEASPNPEQKISQLDVNEVVKKLRSHTDGVGIIQQEITTHSNGGQFFELKILPSLKTIATTSTGKVFVRISDNCFPVSSDELTQLAVEKTAFQWELATVQKIRLLDADANKIKLFLDDIRQSQKVSDFIKNKEDTEILEFFQLIDKDFHLTNLGVLWLGNHFQRARLSYPLTVQYIVYNEFDEKIRKHEWHLNHLNPKELLLEIEKEAVELTYYSEIPDGLFRKNYRQYPKEVVRELLINAFAHKKYTISGDIFIEVYPNRMEITSPGGLPLGITAENILHQRYRRNPYLIQTLSSLNLMEGEGSGYDLIYERLSRDAKPLPLIESDFNKVSVTVFSGSIDYEVISILDYIDKHFQLTHKELITIGIIATEKRILSFQLAKKLQLAQEDKIKPWLGTLIENGIIISQGIKKGTEYLLNPSLFSQAKLDIIPSLKTIEPYKLEALIEEDVKYNERSKMIEIQSRISEVPPSDIQKAVYRLVKKGALITEGARKNRTYSLPKINK